MVRKKMLKRVATLCPVLPITHYYSLAPLLRVRGAAAAATRVRVCNCQRCQRSNHISLAYCKHAQFLAFRMHIKSAAGHSPIL